MIILKKMAENLILVLIFKTSYKLFQAIILCNLKEN